MSSGLLKSPQSAIIALGSNQGDSPDILARAFLELQKLSTGPFLKSSLWKTAPIDCPPGSPDFLNGVAIFETLPELKPELLLQILQNLEQEFGRRRKLILNEPRPLDLDLISFGGRLLSTPALTLPHPRAHLREFVLAPLAELAPDFVLPGMSLSVEQLLRSLPASDQINRL